MHPYKANTPFIKIKSYFTSGNTFFLMCCDLLVIAGVLFWNFEIGKMYIFYFIDLCIFILSYSIYRIILDNRINVIEVLLGTLVIFFFLGALMWFALLTAVEIDLSSKEVLINLFKEYYDLPVFLLFTIRAYYFNLSDYLKYDRIYATVEFTKLLVYNMYLIPALTFTGIFALHYGLNTAFCLCIALVIVRNIIAKLRYNGMLRLVKIQSETSISDK